MKTDTTTKLLLAALAGALWTIALRPAMTPVPAVAQGSGIGDSHASPSLQIGSNIYVAAPANQSGRVYRFKGELGRPVFVGEYGPNIKAD